ncbi:MAG: aminopeptidase P family protein [SAR202 cluster bacterium]|nr:aminopeptidase P family protein [SAR202 cluster bacterium]
MSTRLKNLRAALSKNELDAMLVSTPENRRYVSGFTGSWGYLFITAKGAVLATDFRYVEQAGKQAPDFTVQRIGGSADWLVNLASELGARRIGFESGNMTVATHATYAKSFEKAGGIKRELVSTSGIVEKLRAYKDANELKLIERACDITDGAIEQVRKAIKPGMTEAQVAWDLEKAMRERGAEGLSFDIIVGAGPNGAMAHHRAGDTVIKKGEPIVIDMGCMYKGYASDLTRTLFIGKPDAKFRKVYDTVLEAQLKAEDEVRAGMTGEQADAIARKIIEAAGHGDDFGHSLGHGVGLEVHENPRVGPKSDDVLEDSMVFTIEPGIYLSGWGGVRIEDMGVLENGRARILNTASKGDVV